MSWGVATRNAVGLGLAGIVSLVSRAVQQAVAVVDPFFNYVTLLLPGNGTNGAQNNTFVDSSTNAFTITRNGNTTQGTFSPFSQTGWSAYFDGSGDYLSVAATSPLQFGTGDFAIEMWVNFTKTNSVGGSARRIFGFDTGSPFEIYIFSTGTIVVWDRTTTYITSTVAANTASWVHVAVTRSGTDLKLFLNGVQSGSTATVSTNFAPTTIFVGTNPGGTSTGNYEGYISNLRMVKGAAVYTSAFTPSTTPLTAISGTSLLTCQSNRFIDNSSNAFAITVAGNTSIQAFSPFNPTASWDAATYGGSGYFDGNGDQLGFASNAAFELGSGDFSYEAFVYATRLINTFGQGIISYGIPGNIGTSTCDLQINSLGYLQLAYATGAAATLTDTATFPINQWVHVAVCRSGSTLSMFVNGTRKATASTSATVGTGGAMTIGGQWYANASNRQFQGYISDARVLKGTSAYDATQSSITAPTAPLTAITNTSLLTNFTNAGIYDATSKNDLETVGNAQISTTQSKFGGSSMYFDGTGDYLYLPASSGAPINFATGEDFTIEAWIYVTSAGSFAPFIVYAGGTPRLFGVGTYKGLFSGAAIPTSGNSIFTATNSVTGNTWTHLAFSRVSNVITCYVGGVASGTVTLSANILNGLQYIGIANYTTGFTYPFDGYIQDVRITKGVARYTAAFTPPTAAFPLT